MLAFGGIWKSWNFGLEELNGLFLSQFRRLVAESNTGRERLRFHRGIRVILITQREASCMIF